MKIIYFDGVCILCHWFIQFVLRHDTKKIFSFKQLQNQSNQHKVLDLGLKTVVLEDSGQFFTESEAIDLILKELRFPFSTIPTLTCLIPRQLKNKIYQWVADYRYKIWGKFDTCQIPKTEEKNRFLD